MEPTDQLSDADKIRLKRLAKLQQQAEEQQRRAEAEAQQPKETPTASPTPPKPAPVPAPAPAAASPKMTNDVPQVAQQSPPKPVSVPVRQHAPAKCFEDWQNDALTRILQVSLTLDALQKNPRCIYLHSLVGELEEENEPKPYRITMALLDRVLVSRLSIDPNESLEEYPEDVREDLRVPHFDYLLGCWKRAHEIKRNMQARSKNIDPSVLQKRIEVLDNVKNLTISYSGLVIQMPDMFPQRQDGKPLGPEQLVSYLLDESALPSEYLSELVARFAEDGLDTIIGAAVYIISSRLRDIDVLGDYKPSLNTLSYLCENKTIASMLTTMPEFDPVNATANNIETVSLLGPFLRLTAYPDSAPKVAESFFQNAAERYTADLESGMNGLQGTVHYIQGVMFGVINNIIRSGPAAREAVLSYFAHILRLNEKRAQMQVDPQTVASEGFMQNIAVILLNFCDPFMDVKASKIDKIDSTYFRTSRRLDVKEETKITGSKEQSDVYYGEDRPSKPHNFITEIFFLTLSFFHYGPIRAFVNYNEFKREYAELKRHTERMEEEVARIANTPQGVMQDFVAKRFRARLDQMSMHKIAYEAMMMDAEFLSHAMRYYNLVMSWLIRLVDPTGKHPWQTVSLPLPQDVPEVFAMLPEWIIEDVVEFFIFLGKYCYHIPVFKNNPQEELVAFIITFLRNSKYIKNPYLKAKLVEILFFFTYPIAQGVPGELEAMLNSHPLAMEHLVPSLMAFYVEVEQTGTSSQFYDKFNIRYNISHIMKTIWAHPAHRAKVREESKNNELFTRFVNMLMSDVTYLLDESLSKLSEIHQIQTEMDNREAWEAQPQQQRQEREGTLRALERQAQSYVALGSETVHMLQYLSGEVVEPFMVNEVVDRLAAMLDYNLAQLVGPKCTELKVKNREKYHFNPRKLLSEIIDIYLHLSCPAFVEAVARDGRSYKKEYFSKAASIMNKHRLKHPDDIAALEAFVNKVEEAIQCGVEEEEELGDVPDEFLDPILSSVMEDPVLLPTSNTIVDRSTIRAHLLGDTRDPFSRAPLTMDMVQPATDLKEKIQAWKREQKQKRANATKRDDTMDTSE